MQSLYDTWPAALDYFKINSYLDVEDLKVIQLLPVKYLLYLRLKTCMFRICEYFWDSAFISWNFYTPQKSFAPLPLISLYFKLDILVKYQKKNDLIKLKFLKNIMLYVPFSLLFCRRPLVLREETILNQRPHVLLKIQNNHSYVFWWCLCYIGIIVWDFIKIARKYPIVTAYYLDIPQAIVSKNQKSWLFFQN